MRILSVRNVQEALPRGLQLLDQIGVQRESRNGPVLYGGSVTTIYKKPEEKVCFWPERDANPFFHLYESLWMLAGRNDVGPLTRYAKQMLQYTDDGSKLHGAYGFRWRRHFWHDQLTLIAETLISNPDDRRCVLQMWDSSVDLGKSGKDYPCNTIATFQVGIESELNLHVFCRSNDVVWGAYGANAVQFGTLLEYMAVMTGYKIGTYNQISVNWHGYLNTIKPLRDLRPDKFNYLFCPYKERQVQSVPMPNYPGELDEIITHLLIVADRGFPATTTQKMLVDEPWIQMVYLVLQAHHLFKTIDDKELRFREALQLLDTYPNKKADWIVAASEWLLRRWHKQNHGMGIMGYGQIESNKI